MPFRIVADENIQITPELLSISESLLTLPGRDIVPSHLVDADVLLVRSVTEVNEQLIGTSGVSFVGTATAGVEHIDAEYLAGRSIKFASAPGANANAVVEYVLSVLAARGRIAEILDGGAIGILGYGNVGSQLARVILALGGQAVVWDPWQKVPAALKSPSLEYVLQQPVVSLHASLHDHSPWPSRAIINTPLPAGMPAGQLFINAARGELLTDAALQALCARGTDIVLDVWPDEPAISPRQLAAVSLGTPHIAGYTLSAKILATNMLVEALIGSSVRAGAKKAALQEVAATDPSATVAIDMTGHESTSVAAWLACLLLKSYDPEFDSCELAKLRDSNVRPSDFDALRRHYHLRRELRGRSVLMPATSDALLSRLVSALGALPEH